MLNWTGLSWQHNSILRNKVWLNKQPIMIRHTWNDEAWPESCELPVYLLALKPTESPVKFHTVLKSSWALHIMVPYNSCGIIKVLDAPIYKIDLIRHYLHPQHSQAHAPASDGLSHLALKCAWITSSQISLGSQAFMFFKSPSSV